MCPLFLRNPVHPASGREVGDSWHGGWTVGWQQTSPRERGIQHAGGFSGSRERVSDYYFNFFFLFVKQAS